ncbi:DUF4177 domain-containing protein [Paenibacillus agri]|uniref:DUF4177 domain-containing protein n=1 Tax=Paenibacillus agri TaxID=2744309 RepID=A0A850EKN6_9BACL|nr:DUF4177 domain-containing protein [Paenibacillus agri]NUU59122.1 DUF4177 domain-containing protein [Paenibacillus agri]
MYEYQFVKIEFKKVFPEEYHEIIHKYAREGWKLFQIITPNTYSLEAASFGELIFERTTAVHH